ncbi:MAG: serine/threonine protein kinase with sensor(s) [Acidimicrobiaceae bacterium]|nr:serine/threonine protein kinase with sensor(s) [Acidimicrobiaceae bacterium]
MEPVDDPRLYSNRYQVTHLIARGGMAMVYRAQDTLLNRAVALKILYPELSADPLFVERFRREAQAAANLSHPNIVPVFDWGEDSGTYFIVMELVEGTSLAEMLRGGVTISPARSAQIVAQVAAALGYAHRSGVVHRDVKPGNILITRDGQVKVTDFGIAQAVSSEDHLAEVGSVMGTATYFSPEQASGEAVDGRSDVYALGVVLYEMLVGRPPFVGDTPVDVSSQHVNAAVPVMTKFSDSVPKDLEAIVMESLRKSPDQRYQTADELRADLIRFSEGQPVQAAQRDVAFFGADATRAVAAVPGEKTRSVPIMSGPRTDVRRRRTNYASPIAMVVLVVLLLGGAIGAYEYVQHNKTTITSMPDLVGEKASTATKTLKADGFTVITSYVKSHDAKYRVVATQPKANAHVVKSETITLELSQGITTTPVLVKDYIGMSLANAESGLTAQKLGFKPLYVETAPSGNPVPDQVLSQSPPAGTNVQSGNVVVLTVLAPGAKYQLTDVDGESQVGATSALTAQGLAVNPAIGSACSNTVHSGLVLSTVPVAGSMVTQGSSVKLIVSNGPCQVVVPNVMGFTEAAASAAVSAPNVGLQPSYSVNPADPCTGSQPVVDAQSDLPGSSATYGSTIDLSLCMETTPS